MYSELGWVWLPCILLAAVLAAARHWKNAPELFSPVMQQTTPVGAAVMQRRVYRRLD